MRYRLGEEQACRLFLCYLLVDIRYMLSIRICVNIDLDFFRREDGDIT